VRRLKLVCAASIAVLALVAPGVASAQQYPLEERALVISASSVAAGGSVTIGGTGCLPNSEVEVGIGGEEFGEALGTTMTDGAGAFEATVVIPADFPAGEYDLLAFCLAADGETELVFSAALTVTAPGTGPTATTVPREDGAAAPRTLTPAAPGATLPRTGPDSAMPIAQVAVAMLAVGSVMTALVWRRRQTAAVAGTSVDA
jgi:hypothetical protein